MTEWETFLHAQGAGGATPGAGGSGPRVAVFADLDREYRLLHDGPALVDRSERGLLEITGSDRAAWLHNLTTNEVKNLSAGEGTYAFAVNIQGRILFDLNILVGPESIRLDLDRRWLATARAHFDKYTIMEDVTVTDRSDEFVRLGLGGERAKALLVDFGATQPAAMPSFATARIHVAGSAVELARTDCCGLFFVELLVPTACAVEVWKHLADPSGANPATPVGNQAMDLRRIEAGLPAPGCEITDEYLPAETGQFARAVSFQKGCYLGQEVVERMRSRGAIARRLMGLRLAGDTLPPRGAAVAGSDGKVVGSITSACRSPAMNGLIALAYIKTGSANPNASLTVTWDGGSAEAVVTELPFVDGPAG